METGSWEKDDKTRATMIRNPTGFELTIDESGGAVISDSVLGH